MEFKKAVKEYGGKKRGASTELENLKKKHKDWKDIIPILSTAISNQKSEREKKRTSGGFVAEWKNLVTWINNRCWEEEIQLVESQGIKLQPLTN